MTERVWRLATSWLRWRYWGDEAVVYNDLSGDTLQLDPFGASVFDILLEHPATEAALVRELGELAGAPVDAPFEAAVHDILVDFDRTRVVEPA